MSVQYDSYLDEHIVNVKKGFKWLCMHFADIADKMAPYTELIDAHDDSKYSIFEYPQYDKYFYGGNKSYAVLKSFKYAWLHHIHNNPHHWQYWILAHDDEPVEVLEMPYHYAIEMICDWWSFSWKSGNLTEIFDWYDKHKDMQLHPDTRKLVEETLDRIKAELEKEGGSYESI